MAVGFPDILKRSGAHIETHIEKRLTHTKNVGMGMLTLASLTLAPLTLAPNTARVATEAVSLLSATGTQFPLYILFSIWFQYGGSENAAILNSIFPESLVGRPQIGVPPHNLKLLL